MLTTRLCLIKFPLREFLRENPRQSEELGNADAKGLFALRNPQLYKAIGKYSLQFISFDSDTGKQSQP